MSNRKTVSVFDGIQPSLAISLGIFRPECTLPNASRLEDPARFVPHNLSFPLSVPNHVFPPYSLRANTLIPSPYTDPPATQRSSSSTSPIPPRLSFPPLSHHYQQPTPSASGRTELPICPAQPPSKLPSPDMRYTLSCRTGLAPLSRLWDRGHGLWGRCGRRLLICFVAGIRNATFVQSSGV